MAKTKVLIVDDHPLVRLGLRQMIENESDLEVCGEAGSAGEALELLEEVSPDLVIVDISLPGRSGLELIKQLDARKSSPRVLVNSMHDEKLFAERSLQAGAKGFVNKEEVTTELITAIRDVLADRIYLSPEMVQHMLQVAAGGDAEELGGIADRLSDRELEVLGHLGRGQTTRQIAELLNLSVKTIETHRENLKAKLGLENNNELIRAAVEWWLRQG